MTTLITDNFAGSGSLNSHVPDIGSGTWVSSGTGSAWNNFPVTLSGGYATSTDASFEYNTSEAFYPSSGVLRVGTVAGFSLDFVVNLAVGTYSGDSIFLEFTDGTSGYNTHLAINVDYTGASPAATATIAAYSSGGISAADTQVITPTFGTDQTINWSFASGVHTVSAWGTTLTISPSAVTEYIDTIHLFLLNGNKISSLSLSQAGPFGAEIDLPAFSSYMVATGPVPNSAAISVGQLSLSAYGHSSTGEMASNNSLPSLSISAASGANSVLAVPGVQSSSFGVVVCLADLDVSLPAFSAAVSGIVSSMLSADNLLPSMQASGSSGAVCSVTIGGVTSQATGSVGAVGRAQATLPLFSVDSTVTVSNHGPVQIALPPLSVSSGEIARIALPGLSVSAIGTATITATYEAYALNLNHSAQAGVDAIDEITRYTNFPFTHVVRYKNAYYGANSTGLYLLEGTTDDGVAIQFDVQTGTTDFKLSEKKTVAAAYFSGRFGPDSTISLTSGEKTPNTYSFSTPRGSTAQNHRQVFGKGVKERFHSLRFTGTGECEIDTIELDVHKTSRRI